MLYFGGNLLILNYLSNKIFGRGIFAHALKPSVKYGSLQIVMEMTISWSPKKIFSYAYLELGNYSFACMYCFHIACMFDMLNINKLKKFNRVMIKIVNSCSYDVHNWDCLYIVKFECLTLFT